MREAGESGTAAVVAGGLGHKYRQVWMEIGDTRKGAGVGGRLEALIEGGVGGDRDTEVGVDGD